MKDIISNNNNPNNIGLRSYKIILFIIIGAIVILTIRFTPENVPFWQFRVSDVVVLLISLFLVALFIERAVEVIKIVWREKGKQKIINVISSEKKKGEKKISKEEIDASKELESYRAETKTLVMPTAFVLGIIVSALGIRSLQHLVDPAVFKSIGNIQKALFIGIDVLITGALLGGGSEGIHKILDAFLKLVETRRKNLTEKLMK